MPMLSRNKTLTVRSGRMTLGDRIAALPWGLIFSLVLLAAIGFSMLFSAAGGSLDPWASNQMVRFAPGLLLLVVIGICDLKWVYWAAYPMWAVGFILLIIVDVMGVVGMGAQRWLNLGIVNLQPSEIMKVAVVLALARYYHGVPLEKVKSLKTLIIPALLIGPPVALVLVQPDLGTALMIAAAGTAVVFVAGAPIWLFLAGGAAVAAAVPTVYHFLHPYQKKRIDIFLDPASDPLGAGYHITQSKIAIGSGGLEGKGFLKGTQSHLNFLPEKHTDFIFTVLAEEWGLIGGVALLLLLGAILVQGYRVGLRCRHNFGRLVAIGLSMNFAIYCMINMAMVMGLLPVVGIPLPFLSYGGTVMMSTLIAFGLIACCAVNRNQTMPRGL